MPDSIQYVNKSIATVLEDWKIIRNVPARRDNSNEGTESKVMNLRIDYLPLHLSLRELAKLISIRLMENCINKLEQSSYGNTDRNWMRFLE
jgi:hypothetical protein